MKDGLDPNGDMDYLGVGGFIDEDSMTEEEYAEWGLYCDEIEDQELIEEERYFLGRWRE